MWSRLRSRQVAGFKFRRQFPIGPYFADFACLSARLIVEVDGEGHTQEVDERKTAFLTARGFRVLRIPAQEVDDSIEDVIDQIFYALSADPA